MPPVHWINYWFAYTHLPNPGTTVKFQALPIIFLIFQAPAGDKPAQWRTLFFLNKPWQHHSMNKANSLNPYKLLPTVESIQVQANPGLYQNIFPQYLL